MSPIHRSRLSLLAVGLGVAVCTTPATSTSSRTGLTSLALVAGRLGGVGHLDGLGPAARFEELHGFATDREGNLYVADGKTVRKVALATAEVTTLANTPKADGTVPRATFDNPGGIAFDRAGKLYVASNNGYVNVFDFKTGEVRPRWLFRPPGFHEEKIHLGEPVKETGDMWLAIDGADNLYIADSRHHVVLKLVLATQLVSPFAGGFGVEGAADGQGTVARFGCPQGLATDGSNLYVADGSNDTIRKVVLATGAVTTVAGSPGRAGAADGIGSSAQFDFPTGLALDGRGNLYVSDDRNGRIRKVALSTGEVTTVSTSTRRQGNWEKLASGLALDGSGHLYRANGPTIVRVDLATRTETVLAGSRSGGGEADGSKADARLYRPASLAADADGNVYVAEETTIRKVVLATGAVTTLAGIPSQDSSRWTRPSVDGFGAAARLRNPVGLASDAAGNLFIGDVSTVRKVVIATGQVTTVAGSAEEPGRTDGRGRAARFSNIMGLTSDGLGNLYVADDETIRKVSLATGEVTTLAGVHSKPDVPTFMDSYSEDGTGPEAHFANLNGLAADGEGSVFAADGSAIRRVEVATGKVTALAGLFAQRGPGRIAHDAWGSVDGVGANARFVQPYALATDGSGNLYAVDLPDASLRKIVIATGEVTTVLGAAGRGQILRSSGEALAWQKGVRLGPPSEARLNEPRGLAIGPGPTLYLSDYAENALLVLR